MNININENICEQNDLSLGQVLALGAIQSCTVEEYNDMISKGLITKANASLFEPERRYTATNKGIELFNKVVLSSDVNIVQKESDIEELADKLRELYPAGKIYNTNYYYKSNKADVINKLKTFFKRYGTKYTNEQIIEATRKYVASFNGNYAYLKLLKYFIWKDERAKGESVQSLLADFIENEGAEDTINDDWTSTLK